jgi:glycosyltransferase involved in cell wall biosynthesis
MKVSIIVCFYEKINYLKCCFDALQLCSKDFDEVIVADDGSSDDVAGQVRKFISSYNFPIIHAWHPREGARRSATRNNGIRHSGGDYLVFLDADFVVLPGTIKSHLEVARPGSFVAGRCKYTTEEQTKRLLSNNITNELLESLYSKLPDKPIYREHREFVRYAFLKKLRFVGARKLQFGGHFSIYRKDIEAVNGYDENFIGWGGEDQDMALRLVMAGFEGISAIRKARVLHLWHPHELGNKHWKEGPNIEYFQRKNVPFFCENGLIKIKPD